MKKQLKRAKEVLCLHKALKTTGRHTKALGNTQRPLAKPSAPDNYLNKSKKVHVSLDIWPSMYHFTHFALTNWYITIAKCFYISSIWCAAFPGRSRHCVRPKACAALCFGCLYFCFHTSLVSRSLGVWSCGWKEVTIYTSSQCCTTTNGMKCSITKLQMEVLISGMLINVFTLTARPTMNHLWTKLAYIYHRCNEIQLFTFAAHLSANVMENNHVKDAAPRLIKSQWRVLGETRDPCEWGCCTSGGVWADSVLCFLTYYLVTPKI